MTTLHETDETIRLTLKGLLSIYLPEKTMNEVFNAANERIKRLEEAGDALANTQTYDLLETVNWRKSKEAKP